MAQLLPDAPNRKVAPGADRRENPTANQRAELAVRGANSRIDPKVDPVVNRRAGPKVDPRANPRPDSKANPKVDRWIDRRENRQAAPTADPR
jgi:hypothetical protein